MEIPRGGWDPGGLEGFLSRRTSWLKQGEVSDRFLCLQNSEETGGTQRGQEDGEAEEEAGEGIGDAEVETFQGNDVLTHNSSRNPRSTSIIRDLC